MFFFFKEREVLLCHYCRLTHLNRKKKVHAEPLGNKASINNRSCTCILKDRINPDYARPNSNKGEVVGKGMISPPPY